jgi:hypothetical protein
MVPPVARVRAGRKFALPFGLLFLYDSIMSKSIPVRQEKRRPGRPATGKTPMASLRLPDALADQIDAWARGQADEPGRSEAIRRLIELGLTVKGQPKQPSAARADRAKELATNAVDKIIDPSAPPAERTERRRRLTKGPTEFREGRVDLPDAKK